MRAQVYSHYGGPDMLKLADVPDPEPAEGEVLVRLGMGFPRPRHHTLGFDVAGCVEAVGDGVTQFRIGEDVFGASKFGAFAELVCVNQDRLVPKPAVVSFEAAAATPTAGLPRCRACARGASRLGRRS